MILHYTSLHHVDHINGVSKIDITNLSTDLSTYVQRLFTEITDSDNRRQFEFRSNDTEVRTALTHLISENYYEGSEINANRLLQIELLAQEAINHLNVEIQKGSLFQAVIGETTKSVIISKADHNEYLDELDFTLRKGLPWKKRIFKAFLVNFDTNNSPISLYVYDTNARMSRYWWDSYLELKERYTDTHNTKTSLDFLDKKIFSKIKTDFPADHTIIRNSAIRYFRAKDEFEVDDFINDTFNNYTPVDSNLSTLKIDEFKTNIKALPQRWGFDNRFTIERSEVRKRIVNRIQLTESIDLILKDYIPNLRDSIKSEVDSEGTKWVKIKSDTGFNKFSV